MKINWLDVLFVGAAILTAFNGGMSLQKDWYGEARVYTNVDEHSPLNHGQKTVEIELPGDTRLTMLAGCSAHWHGDASAPEGISWHTAVINTERYDETIRGFVPAPPR
jgi:hypothetical protein